MAMTAQSAQSFDPAAAAPATAEVATSRGASGDEAFLRLEPLQVIPSDTGELRVAEVSRQIGFPVHRAYWLSNVPAGAGRGGHGHRNLRQCFICLRGTVRLSVSKGAEIRVVMLGEKPEAAIVARGCWRDLDQFSQDALVLVLASDEYNEADYFRSRADFDAWQGDVAPLAGVPYLDLARYAQALGPDIERVMRRVLMSGRFIGGEEVERFERAFATYSDSALAVGVGNGLDALALTLRAWGVGPGDEVVAPAHTFIATVSAIEAVGATPVLVDVEPDTGLMDMAKVAQAITPATRAVIPVHLYGHPVDMDGLRQAIGERDIRILEDACQAHGARYKGQACGSLGDAAAFSFYPTKNLGALGDGGAIVTSDPVLAAVARRLGNYGAGEKYRHEVAGGNSRLDPLQAAVLSLKLRHLELWNVRRRRLARRYLFGLAQIRALRLPVVRPWADPVWHVFAVQVPGGARDALQAHLEARGIGTNIHYPTPVHLQPCNAGRWAAGEFPVAERLAASVLSLPLDPLHTEAEIDHVIAAVASFFEGRVG